MEQKRAFMSSRVLAHLLSRLREVEVGAGKGAEIQRGLQGSLWGQQFRMELVLLRPACPWPLL